MLHVNASFVLFPLPTTAAKGYMYFPAQVLATFETSEGEWDEMSWAFIGEELGLNQ